ncbi:MAG: FHA domain-containing protein [Deltaproteobacteria bacterium]|nr:FHA domain-containing protein [Deltaproteobacteria bacterium]
MAAFEVSPFGVLLKAIAPDATSLSLADFSAKYGPAFFVRIAGSEVQPRRPTETKMSDEQGPPTGATAMFVLPVVKRRASTLAFISIGRLDGNDIAIADDSVSKFHAFVKEKDGAFTIQDARSRNGTTVNGETVAPRGDGPPTELSSRASVRFGVVHTSFLLAPDLMELARRMAK